MAASALERIVVRMTLSEKRGVEAKAKRLGMSVSELLRRGALTYELEESDEALGALADVANGAAERASCAIEDAIASISASEVRIGNMESAALHVRQGDRFQN